MLKLTQSNNDGLHYVRPDAIKAMYRAQPAFEPEYTVISLGQGSVYVIETPEQILAMPEMRAEQDRSC